MKIIALILSFYLLFLSTLSCDDFEADITSSADMILLQDSAQDDHSHEEDDDCSPFCICNCCNTACYVVEPPQLTADLFQFQNFNFFYPNKYISKDKNNFFRPPKA